MNLTIETLIVLRKDGSPPVYFTPAEAEQMGGGFAQLVQVIKQGQANAQQQQAQQQRADNGVDVGREQRQPNGAAHDEAAEADWPE